MRISNPIPDLASAIYSATIKDLPGIQYIGNYYTKGALAQKPMMRRPEIYDLEYIELFQQSFGSTSGLFGGIGGQACTTQNIVIVSIGIPPYAPVAVYCNGGFAYLINKPNNAFLDDIKKRNMVIKSGAMKRYETI